MTHVLTNFFDCMDYIISSKFDQQELVFVWSPNVNQLNIEKIENSKNNNADC